MRPTRAPAFVGLASIFIGPAAFAHHSPAAYDQRLQVTIEGIVIDFDWANPHVYFSVREGAANGGGNRVWEVEAVASTIMKQYGWSPETLAEGDRISVTGHPGRNPAKSTVFLQSVRKSGAVLFDAAAMRAPPARTAQAVFSASTLSGTWTTLPGPDLAQFLGQAASLGLTAKGAVAVQEFRDTVNPGADCVPFPAPVYMIRPGFKSIEIRDDVVLIRGEDAAVERTVHMNLGTHGDAQATVQGHSIGHWEGDVLVVDTTRFAEHRMGNAGGLPSSVGKRLVERLELNAGGAGLTYRFTLDDAEYLTGPVTGSSQWSHRPDVPFAATPCNIDNARRFLGE